MIWDVSKWPEYRSGHISGVLIRGVPLYHSPPPSPLNPLIQEFLAYGAMNIIGCFFSSFTAAGSLSRSSIQSTAGGKTQLVGIISSGIILIVLVKLGSLFEQLPRVRQDVYVRI